MLRFSKTESEHHMNIIWHGHSAFEIQVAGAKILIDPFLSGNPAFKGDYAEVIKGTTHIVITHAHADHVGDSVDISIKTGAKIITNYDLCFYLQAQGATNLEHMNTGGTTDQGAFRVTLVRADHSASLGDMGVMQPVGNANGVVLRFKDAPTLYHMGDTDIFSDMALINELYQPKIGIVPIGDRFTMGAETAALAVKRFFTFDTVIPCHYASFPPLEPNAKRFIAALKGHTVNVVVPKVGEIVNV
jgi:L-ascorbate metabolism protein UlaG (beta-lactamase superfamily)